jgi:nitrate reductase NapE component
MNDIDVGEFKHLPPVSRTSKVELFLIILGLYPALSVADFVPEVVG